MPMGEGRNAMTEPDAPVVLSSEMFLDAEAIQKGSGSASVYRLADGSHVLRLLDLKVDNGPDRHAHGASPGPGRIIGRDRGGTRSTWVRSRAISATRPNRAGRNGCRRVPERCRLVQRLRRLVSDGAAEPGEQLIIFAT